MKPRSVLIVDDDAAIRETFERNLRRWGYDVSVAPTAEDALLAVHRVNPAVVITDVRMPEMNGLELLRLLRERASDIDVIVITAFEDMRTAIGAMKAGAFDYLVKPLDLDHIELVLERAFSHRVLRSRVQQLAAESEDSWSLDHIAGRDPRLIEIFKVIGQVARTNAPVLVRGETGTGKELIARAIHFNSSESTQPFVAVNCTAIPETLLESELFGHRKGAFTGAHVDRRGRFSLAGRGTIFLDEIGDTSGAFQARLLRVLQNQEFTPVGAERAERTEARVIAATHRDLESLVRDGAFREDLYFRLRVVEIQVPPLRERAGDLPALTEHFLRKGARALHQNVRMLTPAAMEALTTHQWPGNVRELENTILRALVLAHGDVIDVSDLALQNTGRDAASPPKRGDKLSEVEGEHVRRILAMTKGNKRKAARVLGVSRTRLDRILARHKINDTESSTSLPVNATNGFDSSPVTDQSR